MRGRGLVLLAGALGGAAFEHQGAWLTGDGAAAALWLPPGVHSDDEALGAIVERVGEPEKLEVLGQVGEAMPGYHPEEPHWYLAMIGVDPARRGRGLGSAILEESLRHIDEQGAVAYLENSNPKNVPLYERFGFEVTGLIQPGAFPGLVTMVRRPRS